MRKPETSTNKIVLYLELTLLCCAASTSFAESWIARVSAEFLEENSGYTQLIQLQNGDWLIEAKGGISQNLLQNLANNLLDQQVRYLIPNDELVLNPDVSELSRNSESSISLTSRQIPNASTVQALANSVSQNFLENDGFSTIGINNRQCSEATITILDSGVDSSHSRLASSVFLSPYNAITDETYQQDDYGHGTHIAGLIAASNNDEWSGACANATLMPIRFLNSYGGGRVSDAIKGIEWAISNQADVINHSWTVINANSALKDALAAADDAGILQVFAAGNLASNLDENPIYPASYSTQLDLGLTVANWDQSQSNLYDTSNYGLQSVNIAASGTNLLSLAPGESEQVRSGTSMAAPLVSSALAILKTRNPDWSSEALKAQVLVGCYREDSLADSIQCGGRLYMPDVIEASAVALFNATHLDDGIIQLTGYGLDQDFELDFLNWQTLETSVVKPEAQTDSTIKVVAPGSPGEWQIQVNSNDGGRLPWLPELNPATDLVLKSQANSSDEWLLSWNGVEGASLYEIELDTNLKGFETLASVEAPISQYSFHAEEANLLRVRIKAVQNFWLGGLLASEMESLSSTSEILTIGADKALWQTMEFATLPANASARLLIKLLDSADSENLSLVTITDDMGYLEDGALILNSQTDSESLPLELDVTFSYRSDEVSSDKTYSLSITDKEYWELPWQESSQQSINLLVSSDGLELHSVARQLDGSLELSYSNAEADSLILLRFNQDDRAFDSYESSSAAKIPDSALSSDQRILYLFPEENDETVVINLSLHSTQVSGRRSSSRDLRCFIASVALKDFPQRLAPLRAIKDKLLEFEAGEQLVQLYYEYSPRLANYLQEHASVRAPVTVGLFGVSILIEYWYCWLALIILAGLHRKRIQCSLLPNAPDRFTDSEAFSVKIEQAKN